MSVTSRGGTLSILILLIGSGLGYSRNCGQSEHDKCIRMADPLLTDAHMIFPDNMVDIDKVCRTWTKFVDCIRSYIDDCFTEHRRQQFNKAVEISVDSVHQMCTSSTYQSEYLQHATCLKKTLTDDRSCGRHYRQLALQVQGNREMERDDLCCSHHRFRECVLSETRRSCDSKVSVTSQMLPSAFSKQTLDKALSFLRDQCSDYSPSPEECSGYMPSSNRVDQSADELTDSTHVIGPTYTIGNTHTVVSDPLDPINSEKTEPDTPPTLDPSTWIPSRDGRRRTTQTDPESTGNDPSTRSSFGRGVTWEPTLARDDLFKATHYKPSTEAWYPGNNINYHKEVEDFNSIDIEEPNQQGLSHLNSDNDANTSQVNSFLLLLTILLACLVPR